MGAEPESVPAAAAPGACSEDVLAASLATQPAGDFPGGFEGDAAVAALGALLEAVQVALLEGLLQEGSEAELAASLEQQAEAGVAAAAAPAGPRGQKHSGVGGRGLQRRVAGTPEQRAQGAEEGRLSLLQERWAEPGAQGTQPGAAFSAGVGLRAGVESGTERRERLREEWAAGQGPGGAGASRRRLEVLRTAAASARRDAQETGVVPWGQHAGAAGVPLEGVQYSQSSWIKQEKKKPKQRNVNWMVHKRPRKKKQRANLEPGGTGSVRAPPGTVCAGAPGLPGAAPACLLRR